jgi:hypothetical protein
MASRAQFTFNDTATFAQNIAAFSSELARLDGQCGPILSPALPTLADETQDKSVLLNDLFAKIDTQDTSPQENADDAPESSPLCTPPSLAPSTAVPVRWFLEGIEIEGFRGINNEGAPLTLKFKPNCVSSISAPNGVGKSSVYDALSFALTGKIPKLDRLLQAEHPQDYYLNRFHTSGVGTVKLSLLPDNGGAAILITVTRTAAGVRNVVGPAGIDTQALLADLNREFVLLDAQTFQSFIDDKALDRGRAFSGLLGLARYSVLRQQLQALCNTRAFNTHFDTTGHAAKKTAADRNVATANAAIASDYENLVKEPITAGTPAVDSQERCQAALQGIPVLVDHCSNRPFMEVDIDACIGAIKSAEGGPKRERLSSIIRAEAKWAAATKALPTLGDLPMLATLAAAREDALNATSGDMLHKLYRLSEQIMAADAWPSPTLCPTCGKDDGTSVLDGVRAKLGQFDAVEAATLAVAKEWAAKGWADLIELETLTLTEAEAPRLRQLTKVGAAGTISANEAKELAAHIAVLRARATAAIASLSAERTQLEKELPPSLVAVTTAVETARRLQTNWKALETAEAESVTETARNVRLTQLKTFLDCASTSFAIAESAVAVARLQKVEPLCQELFRNIMFSPVIPALQKPQGSEELGIRLAEFWGLNDVSAQALLSESYRNGFAVSVYLAAASLYGGAPRFIILDDVTSSFDAGHQHHLVEVIRTRFSCPVQVDGPQVILLSHDTLLEKLFNKHSGSAAWSHQRLEGTARTAVLPQSGAVNKVRDATIELLNAGRVDDAAPRVRQYLEYTLHAVIDRCRIPVPLDLAFGDDKRTPGEYLKAIEAAVALESRANTLILEATQVQNLQLHSATIVGNFLAHWSTGQTQAFSAPALLGVMQAIDDFPGCFKYEPTPGARKEFYTSLSRR